MLNQWVGRQTVGPVGIGYVCGNAISFSKWMRLTIYHYKQCIRPLDVRKLMHEKITMMVMMIEEKIPCTVKIMHLFITQFGVAFKNDLDLAFV